MRAVSIKMVNGKTITLMPFASISVKRGSRVSEGQSLGTLAASGDISSPGAHLHMGLKQGRTYYDPMTLFGLSSTTAAAVPERQSGTEKATPSAEVAAGATALGESGAAHANASASASEQVVPAAQGSLQGEVADAPEGKAQQLDLGSSIQTEKKPSHSKSAGDVWKPGHVTSGDVTWEPAAETTRSPLAVVGAAADPFLSACSQQAAALVSGLESLSQRTGLSMTAVYLVALAVALVGLTAGIWAFAVWILPFVSSLWRKANSAWSSRDRSDKLLGLFPAPGSAFITRGR